MPNNALTTGHRPLTSLALAALLAAPFVTAAAPADGVAGTWTTEKRDAQVRIAPCGAHMCGKIVKFLKPPPDGIDQRDVRNPNASLRNRKLIGLTVLSNYAREGDQWRGRIYDPKSGKSYRSVMFAKNGRLVVKGCLGPICKSQTWSPAG